ncbi:MAG: ATPase associated with various cellular, 5 [Ramlibacter sp.]|nr:ATPase associated with various cellular, 5 [Ramlibacter sp.]
MQESSTNPAPLPKVARYKIRTAFNLSEAPEAAEITGLEPGLANVPAPDPRYVFEADTLRQLCMFWAGGFRALMIEGDPAAGKTSLVDQYHARLNVPLYKVACTPTTESFRLVGQLLPTPDGKLAWHDGPVVRACREGSSVLLDEYNTLDPGEATGLNMLLEGYSWTIPETGEVVSPAPTTRFFGTQNAVDSKAAVAGRNLQDVANEDRWSFMRVRYIAPEAEKALVQGHLVAGRIPEEVARTVAAICVDVANKVRQAFRDDATAIDKPLSTRVVLRWAKYTILYTPIMKAQGRSAVHYAINQAVRMSPEMAVAVAEMITLIAGYGPQLGPRS